jgi:adenosylcobinamide-phosphate synthase
MSLAYPFALALAAALIDVTLGYPQGLARRIGAPADWLSRWFGLVRAAGADWSGGAALAAYLGPVVVGAAVIAELAPGGPVGFAITALLASTLCGRQSLDICARAAAREWESAGPLAALATAEPLGPEESEPRVGRAVAAALAARFADEVATPTLFLMIGGLPGLALGRALGLGARRARERRDASPLAAALAQVERWTLAPTAREGAALLALAAMRPEAWRALTAPAPAPAVMLAALGRPARDAPDDLRAALAIFRRAAAAEMAALAGLALLGAALG